MAISSDEAADQWVAVSPGSIKYNNDREKYGSPESLWINPLMAAGAPNVFGGVAGPPISGHAELATLPNVGTPAP